MSSKFSQRPVPRRRPAICASLRHQLPDRIARNGGPPIDPFAKCLPPFDVLCPPRLQISFGWVDLDPGLPPEDRPMLFAAATSDPKTGDPPCWHAQHKQGPFELHVWIQWEALPGRCSVTLRKWWFEESEDFTWDPVWFNPFVPFDSHLLTHTHIRWKDYRWVHATC